MCNIPFTNLGTERLLLRQLTEEDASVIYAMHSDKENNRYIDRSFPETVKDSLFFINKINTGIRDGEWCYWALTLVDFGNVVGTICLWHFSEDRLCAEVGFELHPDYHSKGYMQEALTKVLAFGYETLRLQEIEGYTHRNNLKSIALMKRNGFTFKGILKETNEAEENMVIYNRLK